MSMLSESKRTMLVVKNIFTNSSSTSTNTANIYLDSVQFCQYWVATFNKITPITAINP